MGIVAILIWMVETVASPDEGTMSHKIENAFYWTVYVNIGWCDCCPPLHTRAAHGADSLSDDALNSEPEMPGTAGKTVRQCRLARQWAKH